MSLPPHSIEATPRNRALSYGDQPWRPGRDIAAALGSRSAGGIPISCRRIEAAPATGRLNGVVDAIRSDLAANH